jgi:hypothetical protein
MEEGLELTVPQCRFVARLRERNPSADVILHPTRAGVIVEVREGRRCELARVDVFGRVHPDHSLRTAVARRHAAPRAA